MKRLSKRLVNYVPYTRSRSSLAIDIRKFKSAESIANYFMESLDKDWGYFYKCIKYSILISGKVLISQERLKEQLYQLLTDATSDWIIKREEGIYNSEYFSLFIHKLKSGKIVMTLFINLEI